MKKIMIFMLTLALVFAFFPAIAPAQANDRITYISQPEAVAIFLNNVAFAKDTLSLAGNAEAEIRLPIQIFQDTLIVREDGQRVPTYRIHQADGQLLLNLAPSSDENAVRTITLEYLLSGLTWKPTYDMWLGAETDETVQLDFFVEIQNSALPLNDVDVTLVAGRVDTSRQVDTVSEVTMNQYIAGYDEAPNIPGGNISTGPVTIQNIYQAGKITAEPGETIYLSMLESEFPARRVLLWNAQSGNQVSVIYKVRNESDLPLAEGIVRSYKDGLFIGSDFIELTPIGSEGSVTVGGVQDVRVHKDETRSRIEGIYFENIYVDTLHEVTLTLNNYGENPIEIEVVDSWPYDSQDFTFSEDPERQPGNLFRWSVTIEPGDTHTIEYSFKSDS